MLVACAAGTGTREARRLHQSLSQEDTSCASLAPEVMRRGLGGVTPCGAGPQSCDRQRHSNSGTCAGPGGSLRTLFLNPTVQQAQ